MPAAVQALATATAEGTPVSEFSTPIPPGIAQGGTDSPELGTITFPDIATPEPTPEPGEPTSTPTPTNVPLPDWDGSDPIHVLLLGIDTRPSEETEGRSDTMIVVRVDPIVKRVDMFSIPRDLVVSIPGFSDGVKVNSAYPWGEWYDVEGGGPALIAQTIELNFGVRIDYYATVDIPGLEQIVDTVGGVIIDVQAQLKDDQYPTEDYGYTRAYFASGIQRLDGVEAVQYARTRHADSDFQRAHRQQQLLFAIRDQVLETGLISRLPELIGDLRRTVRTDLSPRQVLSLASLAQEIDRADIWAHSLTPYTYPVVNESGWFLFGDWDSLRWITQNLSEDPLATNLAGD
jgi:LCP family protein required for cell wall assembly